MIESRDFLRNASAKCITAAKQPDFCESRSCALFQEIQNQEFFTAYLQERIFHDYRARQSVFYQGTAVALVHILCEGAVKLVVSGRFGIARTVPIPSAARTPCEILDKACLARDVHSLTCETLTPCRICCVPRSTFLGLMQHIPTFSQRVLSALSTELGVLLHTLHEDRVLGARGRLANILLELADLFGVPIKEGVAIEFPLRRQELAELIGTSRETAARLLSDLTHARIITITGRHIRILDIPQLQQLASQPAWSGL